VIRITRGSRSSAALASYIVSTDFVSERVPDREASKCRCLARNSVVALSMLVAAGCGPELTRPSEIDLTGAWSTTAKIGPITDIHLTITQRADGSLAGNWSGKSSVANPPCPPDLGLNPANTVTGSNTVLEVSFEVLGAGEFEGQAISRDKMQGSFRSCSRTYPVDFLRATSNP